VAAAAWALQQPLDKLAFGSRYDDVELLGRGLTRGRRWYPLGLSAHVANGAIFGGLYANLAPSMPLPPHLRGPAAGLAEHFGLWPLVAITDSRHPAREQLPRLSGNRRAMWQAAWRHLLFGVLLGELELRLNAAERPGPPPRKPDYSSNGHGSFEHTMTVMTTGPGEGESPHG
jgi:hypothetical protein